MTRPETGKIHYIALLILAIFANSSLLLAAHESVDSTYYYLYKDFRDKDYPKAIEYAEMFVSDLEPSRDDIRTAKLCDSIAEYYEKEKYLYSKALKWRERAMSVYEKAGEKKDAAMTGYHLASLSYQKVKYHDALRYATEALKYFEENNDCPNSLELYNLLAAIYYQCKDSSNTNKYIRKYLSTARRLNDSSAIALALNNMAVFYSTDDSVKTNDYLTESINICRQKGDSTLLCKLYINIASINIYCYNFSDAHKYLDLAFPLLSGIQLTGDWYFASGTLCYYEKEYRKAIDYLKESITYYSQGEMEIHLQAIYLMLNDIYRETGDIDNAYSSLCSYYEIDTSLAKEDMLLEVFRYQKQILEQKEYEEHLRRKFKTIAYLIPGICILVMVITYVYHISKKKNEIIRHKNKELSSQNEILEMKKLQQYHSGRIAKEVAEKLYKLNSEISDHNIRNKIRHICSDLENTEEQNTEIRKYIPEFNTEFTKNLLKDFPDLTVNERRLCVFLNMNLTTKEISEITRQSIQSINTARSRLRNKLGLAGDNISIQEFLSKYN